MTNLQQIRDNSTTENLYSREKPKGNAIHFVFLQNLSEKMVFQN